MPRELKAVLHIFSSDEELRIKAIPHICFWTSGIDWYSITIQDFDSNRRAAIAWAKCLWTDQPGNVNPFELALSMDSEFRETVLEAIAIRWSLPRREYSELRLCA